jgi:proteasome lid subunit RPN8/RPN11
MIESCSSDGLLGTWAIPECPFTISYSLRALDDIRLAVVDAFFSLPRGGAEIGGILLGKPRDQQVTILDYVPLDCEHALGPSFSLSPKDLERLSLLLEQAKKNSVDLQPVGWYHSHTRSEIFLSEADLEIHRKYFPGTSQVALVLKPHTFQPMRAGFFFQGADGGYHSEASYQEFVLEPLPMRPVPSPDQRLMGTGRMRLESEPTGNIVAVPPTAIETPVASNVVPAVDDVAPQSVPPAAADPEIEPEPTVAAPEPEATVEPQPEAPPVEIPIHFPDLDRRPRWRLTAILGVAAALAVAAVAYQTRDAWVRIFSHPAAAAPPGTANSLGLVLVDRDGDLQIAWNRRIPAIQTAARGTLVIASTGGTPTTVQLTSAQLQTGSVTFKRESEKLEVALSVENTSGVASRESANFMGRLPAQAKPQAQSESDAAQNREMERLKGQLKAEIAKNQQLLKYSDQKIDVVAEAERLRNQLNTLTARNKELEGEIKPKDDQIARLQNELNVQKSHNRVLAQSLDETVAQLKQQQRKRLNAQDTAK